MLLSLLLGALLIAAAFWYFISLNHTGLIRLTCVDGIYKMASNGAALPAGTKCHGKLILGNDFHTGMKTDNILILADS